MACLFAGRLAAAGFPVSMLGSWKEGLDALEKQGITLIEENNQERVYRVKVFREYQTLQNIRFVLVLAKSWQTAHIAQQLENCLTKNGVALTLQNGIGNRELLSEVLGAQRVALGITTVGANLLAAARVQAAGEGIISLSEHSRLSPLADMLVSAGFSVETVPDPDVLLWSKLVINAAINPLTAILGVTNGELLTRPTARALMVSLVRETAAVAAASGIHLPYPDPIAKVEEVAQRTSTNRSSMLQDVSRRAPTEIDAICGAIARTGEQVSVQTPVNNLMWQLVKALVHENRR